MSCVKCGRLYCICDLANNRLSATEQILLEMWERWIDGRVQNDTEVEDGDDIPDSAPRIALHHFRNDNRVSWLLLELMAKFAREYGYEL